MKTLVLGIGNLLLGDEGVGVHVAQRLQRLRLPPDVEAVDGGTAGFELARFFAAKEKAIIVDAILADAEPGEVYRIPAEQLTLRVRPHYSAHYNGLHELLDYARRTMPSLTVVIFGIVPKTTTTSTMTLSEEVERSVADVIPLILKEVSVP